ncbi:phage holin family protein [Tropheryma whipplei]|uniref:phage holin family protein n=1 Tax=Tropheryma whipplei TaxID=2039 RepID=UPI0004B74FDC|nr:phage holin family protein [Tropheryma whipplei]
MRRRRSLFALIGGLPLQVLELVKAEVLVVRAVLFHRLRLVLSSLFFLVAGFVLAGLTLQAFLAVAVLLLSLALPLWAAFLAVAVLLLILTSVSIALAMLLLSRARGPVPEQLQAEETIMGADQDGQPSHDAPGHRCNTGVRDSEPQV